jgi:hypothetical protein
MAFILRSIFVHIDECLRYKKKFLYRRSAMKSCAAAEIGRDEADEGPGADALMGSPEGRPTADERVLASCECVIDLAAAFFNVPSKELRRPGRCADDVSRVRQIAMYVAHVVLGLSMAEVGRGFGRDRTTVMHACHTIEDLRDDEDADAIVVRMERVVAAAFRGHRL